MCSLTLAYLALLAFGLMYKALLLFEHGCKPKARIDFGPGRK